MENNDINTLAKLVLKCMRRPHFEVKTCLLNGVTSALDIILRLKAVIWWVHALRLILRYSELYFGMYGIRYGCDNLFWEAYKNWMLYNKYY